MFRGRPASQSPHGSEAERGPLRVIVIDDHTISRACRALLRTEGVDVVADAGADGGALEAVAVLRRDVVVIDV